MQFDGFFTVKCCGGVRRRMLPAGVLFCLICDTPTGAQVANGANITRLYDVLPSVERYNPETGKTL